MEQDITKIQAHLTQHFAQLIQQNRLAHAYLFTGNAGVGKLALAVWVAQGIFCEHPNSNGFPCLQCNECQRIAENEHPDVVRIVPDGRTIKVDQMRYLKAEFTKSGLESNRKVFIIQNAEKMTNSAANSLLKFIEEPVGEVTAFLLTSHPNQVLPTIISRCQVVELQDLNADELAEKLEQHEIPASLARILVHLNANFDDLVTLGNDEHFQKLVSEVANWLKLILKDDWRSFVWIQTKLMPLIENQQMQERLLELILLINRDLLMLKFQANQPIIFSKYQSELASLSQFLSVEQITQGIEAILNCWNQLAVNVNFQNVLEALTLKLNQLYQNR